MKKLMNSKRKPQNGKPKLSDFCPQIKNLNLGRPHGLAALDKSIRRDGYSAPMVAAADGEIFAGSKRLERVADIMPDVAPIVVHSDGTRPIIHVRDDIPTAADPRAVRLGYADNAIAAVDWNPDSALLAALAVSDKDIAELARQDNASLRAMAKYAPTQEMVDAGPQSIPMQFLIVLTCKSERQQIELLERFQKENLECRALLS